MNPFMVLNTVITFGASVYEFYKGDKYFGMLYMCYGLSNILLMIISSKLK